MTQTDKWWNTCSECGTATLNKNGLCHPCYDDIVTKRTIRYSNARS